MCRLFPVTHGELLRGNGVWSGRTATTRRLIWTRDSSTLRTSYSPRAHRYYSHLHRCQDAADWTGRLWPARPAWAAFLTPTVRHLKAKPLSDYTSFIFIVLAVSFAYHELPAVRFQLSVGFVNVSTQEHQTEGDLQRFLRFTVCRFDARLIIPHYAIENPLTGWLSFSQGLYQLSYYEHTHTGVRCDVTCSSSSLSSSSPSSSGPQRRLRFP